MKRCPVCRKKMTPRPNEKPCQFANRKTCGTVCGTKSQAAKLKGRKMEIIRPEILGLRPAKYWERELTLADVRMARAELHQVQEWAEKRGLSEETRRLFERAEGRLLKVLRKANSWMRIGKAG